MKLPESEVEELIEKHKLTAYRLGDQVLRIKKDQVWEVQSKIRISSELFPNERAQQHHVALSSKGPWVDHAKDFFYFNDFYIVTFILITALLYLILSSQ